MNAPWPTSELEGAFSAPARIHVWRAYPFRPGLVPQSGWYAVAAQPAEYLRRGAPFPRTLT